MAVTAHTLKQLTKSLKYVEILILHEVKPADNKVRTPYVFAFIALYSCLQGIKDRPAGLREVAQLSIRKEFAEGYYAIGDLLDPDRAGEGVTGAELFVAEEYINKYKKDLPNWIEQVKKHIGWSEKGADGDDGCTTA